MKKAGNFFFHLGLLALMAVVMVIDVSISGANNFDQLSIYGKIAGVIFTADLLGFVLLTFILMVIQKKKK